MQNLTNDLQNYVVAFRKETLQKALQTQVLAALTSNFGLVGLVQQLGRLSLVWLGRFSLASLVW